MVTGFSSLGEEVEGRGDLGDEPLWGFEAFIFWGAGDEERSEVSGYPAGEDLPPGEAGVEEGNSLEVGSVFAGAEIDCVATWVAGVPSSTEGPDPNPEKVSSNEKDFVLSGATVGSFGTEKRLKSSSVRVGAVEPLTSAVGFPLTVLAGGGTEGLGVEKLKNSSKLAPEVNGWLSETGFEAPAPLRVGFNPRASSNADIPVLSAAEGTVVDVPVKEGSNGLVDSLNVSKVSRTL